MGKSFFVKHSASEITQKLVTKAVFDYNLIEDGDSILIAVSGGKDSSVLSWALSSARYSIKKDYKLLAVHISTDFCNCCSKGPLRSRLNSWDIEFEDIFVPVTGRLKAGRKMNCYWCSTQRRGELISFALKNNCNKIALGHHLDDILETYFMNITQSGILRGMPARIDYNKYPVTLIRPLAYLEEKQVIACANEQGILKAVCTCPYGLASKRRAIRSSIADFTGGNSAVKRRIFAAFENQHTEKINFF
ncbi:MAG: tRNA 2-thiocytidine biosynthesis TtcA family protein [Spirochaetaceae bacterium]|jgi:tRNA 2-thiocytidine biosynthesis protein TtcA|nr:tRNA 2-thiocytidine biosynthesis TtcA family protein [Spirochaetaceae bacterium]GMO16791.1 MAG: tRNA 2-thiocytidine biosynthesis TtcA family protein [Termitinemataceae bacterium]